jgi:hypothetical protein
VKKYERVLKIVFIWFFGMPGRISNEPPGFLFPAKPLLLIKQLFPSGRMGQDITVKGKG